MVRRTRTQWQSLIAEFESSGLSQTVFCQRQGLNAKYFSLKRGSVATKVTSEEEGFSRVAVAPPKPKESTIVLQVGRVNLQLGASTPPDYVAQIVRLLA